MQLSNDLYAESRKAADVHDELTLNNIFEKVDPSICSHFQEFRVTDLHVDGTDIGFRAQSLLANKEVL